jgi:4-hydroxybenzoate polyprenyltransferase
VSRAEFVLPNLGSLIMGLAWGASRAIGALTIVVVLILSFVVINLSSAIGAQINTLSDHELDLKDERKKKLVSATDSLGDKRIRTFIIVEFVLTLIIVSTLAFIEQKPLLIVLWVIGISLGWAYSSPPLRIKSRSWLAPVTLILVLAAFPAFFAYYAFTSEINPFFLLSLVGLGLTVYGVIIPTEIRDYFGDEAMNVQTMTVKLGLTKASSLSIILLSIGAVVTCTAYLLEFAANTHAILAVFLLVLMAAVLFVLRRFVKLHSLAKELAASENSESLKERIISLSAHNPQWIMLVTQSYNLIAIVLFVSKFVA